MTLVGWFAPPDPDSSPAVRWSTGVRLLAAAALVLGPAFQVVSFALEPEIDATIDRLAWIRANPDTAPWVKVADVLAMPFLVGSAVVYAMLARDRSPRLALAAGVTLGAGLVGLAVHMGTEVLLFRLATAPGQDPAVLAAAVDGALSPAGATTLLLFLPFVAVGIALASVALWRSRAVPRTAAVLLPVFLVVDVAVSGLVGHLIEFIAMAWIALAVVSAPRRRATAGQGARDP